MNLDKLAVKLLHEKRDSRVVSSFTGLSEPELSELAFALKEISYDSWTKEPTIAQNSARVLGLLSKHSDSAEIDAVSCWIEGIANITRGKILEAIENLEHAANRFFDLEAKHLAAQTQVSKLYGLALLGRYDEAIDCGQEALKTFEKFKDELAAGKIELNLGNIFMRREQYVDSERFLLFACRRFSNLKDTPYLTMAENSLAITLTMQNRFREAEKVYEKALARANESGMLVTQAEIEASMGNLALFRGRFAGALRFLEASRQKFETLGMPHQTTVAELEMADAYLELNLATEAFEIYEKIGDKLAISGMQGEEARARANYARAAISLRKEGVAGQQLKRAKKLYTAEKNSVGVAFVKLIESQLALTNADYKTALELADKALSLFEDNFESRHSLTARWLRAESLMNLGENKKVEKSLLDLAETAEKRSVPGIKQLAQISLGKLNLKKRKLEAAERHFRQAIELIETSRRPLPAEEFRIKYLSDKLIPYTELAKIYLDRGQFHMAFSCVERIRSRSLSEFDHGPNDNGKNRKLIPVDVKKKLSDLRESLNWSYRRLQRAKQEEHREFQTEVEGKEKKISELMRRYNSSSGTGAEDEILLDIDTLQKKLGKRSVLLYYLIIDNKISVFVVSDRNIEFVRDFANTDDIEALLKGMQFQMETLRYRKEIIEKFGHTLKEKTDYYLAQLHEKLILPVEPYLKNRDIVVVPSGKLFYVPFHALKNGDKYMIEDREISYAPNASLLVRGLSEDQMRLENILLLGFADDNNQYVYEEIEAIRNKFSQSRTFVKQAASISNLKKNVENIDILHLACHGNFRSDNPMFSSLKLSDGWVTVQDIYNMELNCCLVTLSACETGRNQVFKGDELLGLARGFLSSGANSLLLTLWTVNDSTSARFMKGFYSNLRNGETMARSLQKVQCEFIDNGMHPYFWSPFFLIGK